MSRQPDSHEVPPDPPPLKVAEPQIERDDPWSDDVLDRAEVAKLLTNIVHGQRAPFVISLDGRWGTGKTFLLKRWQQDLQNHGFEAIYFNAWEDDFSVDPLLAIIGQLSEHFGDGVLQQITSRVARAAGRILVHRVTGASVEGLKPESLLEDYREQRKTKTSVRERLTELATSVSENKGLPLVFIIDELDRCRPHFALELLERVKHIFDVPNIVSVFGINRAELMKSLQSIYGEIDAGTYLRRFFDMEFILPDVDPAPFCEYLATRFGLHSFLATLRPNMHFYLDDDGDSLVPAVLGRMGLALRDMDYCLRLLAMASTNREANAHVYPELFVLLVATKVDNPDLFRRFAEGDAQGVDLIDNLHLSRAAGPRRGTGETSTRPILNWVEAAAYHVDDPQSAREQLLHVNSQAGPLSEPLHISLETSRLDPRNGWDKERLDKLLRLMPDSGYAAFRGYGQARRRLPRLIDLYAGLVRR